MDTHFSGAQRQEGRRRRRLAAESDGPSNPDGTGQTTSIGREASLGTALGNRAAPGSESVRWQRHGAIPLVPQALWKHFALAFLIMALGGGLLSGVVALYRNVPWLPAGSERIFSPETGTVARAFPALLLLLAGQTALVIRWYRSRSLHDFDGRYRLWTRVALSWFLMSACVATDAHLAWSDACRQLLPLKFWQADTWSWLGPIALAGVVSWLPLYREMQGSRLSVGCFLISCSLYLVAASLRLQCVSLATPELNWFVLHAITWSGHLLLLLSMSLHARHVIHFTIEPAAVRARHGRRRDGSRLDWFKPTCWFRRAVATEMGPSEVGEAKKSRSRRKPSRAKSTAKSDTVDDKNDAADSEVDKSNDVASTVTRRTARPIVEIATPANGTSAQPAEPRIESPPITQPTKASTFQRTAVPTSQSEAAKVSIPRPGTAAPFPPATAPVNSANNQEQDDEGDGDDLDESESGQQDFRGLSKKQRRKLMREMRDRGPQVRR